MRDHPFPASWTVRRARDAYLAENGFTVEAYDDAWTEGAFLGLSIKVPNTPHHRWAIMLDDLHHIACGFGTDLAGEGEMAVWEVRRGLTNLGPYVSAFVLMAFAWGLALAPRRSLASWRASGVGRRSLFASSSTEADYEGLLGLTVGELREALGVPHEGIAKHQRSLHSRAPVRPQWTA